MQGHRASSSTGYRLGSSGPRVGLSAVVSAALAPSRKLLEQAKQMLAEGKGIIRTANDCKLGTSTVHNGIFWRSLLPE